MANEIDHGGSGWTDQETGITYNASGEAINAPDTGGSSHFDANGQLWMANGEKVDMSAYAPITSPENYPGGFWGYYQHLVDTGQVNNDTQGLGGVAGFLRSHGYMVPLALMTAGAAAAEGAAGAGALESGAGGLAGGGFVPAAGSGANFAIDTGATYGLAGAAGAGGGIAGGLGTGAELAGPTYGELGVTGLPEGAAGPTYGEMGYTGLNQGQAIASADAAAQNAQILDALKTANQVRQGASTANSIAKLLSGANTATKAVGSTGATSNTGGLNLNSLASLLNPSAQTSNYVGQIKANQNPFTFTSAGQTLASPGMYDVSGSNLANALRKA